MSRKISLVLAVLMVLGTVFGALEQPIRAYDDWGSQEREGRPEPVTSPDSDLTILKVPIYAIRRGSGTEGLKEYKYAVINTSNNFTIFADIIIGNNVERSVGIPSKTTLIRRAPIQAPFKVEGIQKRPQHNPSRSSQGDSPSYFKFDASTGTIQGLTSAGEAYYKNNGGKMVIPGKINGINVKIIGDYALSSKN